MWRCKNESWFDQTIRRFLWGWFLMCVYLLLVSHGALSSHHNLAAGLCLQLFGCQSTWAQDPPYEVELHKKKQYTLLKKKTQAWRKITHILHHNLILSFCNVSVYLHVLWVTVPLRFVHLWCVCVTKRDKNSSLYGCWLVLVAWQDSVVLLTLSVTTTEWLSRQLPLWVCVRLCVCVCYYPSVSLLLLWRLFSHILLFNSSKV